MAALYLYSGGKSFSVLCDRARTPEPGCCRTAAGRPAKLAQEVAQSLTIPVIGIGAGNGVDGQVLVTHDMLGMTHEFNPRFLRRYQDMYQGMTTAFKNYSADVKSGDFPNDTEQY